MKSNNISIMEVPEREDREQETKNISKEIMIKNFPNLVKKRDTHKSKKYSHKQG